MRDSKVRFSDRVNDYKKFRPTYPPGVVSFILDNCPVAKDWKIADIGSGTGISTKLFLDGLKCSIYAVEPNKDMRMASEESLKDNSLFSSVDGCAENTNLPNNSIDMIAAFQAFHWFDKPKTRIEFARILKEPKWVVFVWNDRIITGKPFLEGYEELMRSIPEYGKVSHKDISSEIIADFLCDKELKVAHFPKIQEFDFEGLKGRLFSSSYTPGEGTEERRIVTQKLKELFDKFNTNGLIELEYRTDIYLGRLQ